MPFAELDTDDGGALFGRRRPMLRMSDKPKFAFTVAHVVAMQIVDELTPACEYGRIVIAGSLRRCEKAVGDIEIVYVPKFVDGTPPGELVERSIDLSIGKIWNLIDVGVLVRRQNTNGSDTFGPRNKLMRHVQSQIPVDLFATDERSWANYLVCRTGPAAFNIRVANRARALGWKWHPYDAGFSRQRGLGVVEWQIIRSEEQLFEFLGWQYCQPWERAAGNSPVSATRRSEEKTGVEAQSAKAEPATQKPGLEAGRAHA